MRKVQHQVDFCVVGGGLAGLSAAVTAARHGARVALLHDRPVPGGNASSEIRMWVCGARGPNRRETGLIEEIQLDNRWRNPLRNFSLWDSILYEKIRAEPNLIPLFNCSCNQLARRGRRIRSVTGWQTTTETWHTVEAHLFADCSGDSILAPLSGADFRIGREARAEFGESIEPRKADTRTMGMSCLLQARETDRPQPYIPPPWAHRYRSDDDLPHRPHDFRGLNNFWWIELGGEQDSIHDTEKIRDALLKAAFGIWDHIKNHGDHGAENWVLDWVGFLPGKRESRRYLGDHILTQNDVRAGGRFPDTIAYGGWPMDDHHPGGLRWRGEPTIFHPAPSPFGIPYGCLYSRNIANLFCAGRNISVTHAALSSTRVMATCATLGQAVGTAAALAARRGCTPREVGRHAITEIQARLMEDDAWLPGFRRTPPALTRTARLTASQGDPEPLRNGFDRPDETTDNGWSGPPGAWVEYAFPRPVRIRRLRFVFDSDLNRPELNIPSNHPWPPESIAPPRTLIRSFRIEIRDASGAWRLARRVDDNHQRLVRIDLNLRTAAVRWIPETTWGAPDNHLFAWEVDSHAG